MVVNNFFVAYWLFVCFSWRHSYLSPLLIFKLSCFYCWIVRIFYMFWIQFPLVAMWFTEILSHSVCSFYFLFPFLFFFFFWPCLAACGIFAPWLWVKPVPPVVEMQSPTHRIAKEFPLFTFLIVPKIISKVVVSFCIPFSDEHLCIFKPFIHPFSN